MGKRLGEDLSISPVARFLLMVAVLNTLFGESATVLLAGRLLLRVVILLFSGGSRL